MNRPSVRLVALVVALATAAAVAGWVFGRPALARRHDVAVRRSLYRSFPVYPGATKTGERSFELDADGRGTGDYALTLTYRLPPAVSPAAVVDFYRRNMPAGWTEANDELCAQLERRMPPPPLATVPPGAAGDGTSPPTAGRPTGLVLLRQEGELAVFAPGGEGADGRPWRGITFRVTSVGPDRALTVGEVSFACGPASG